MINLPFVLSIAVIIFNIGGFIYVFRNHIAHINKDLERIRHSLEGIYEKLDEHTDRISRIEGRMNGGK